MECPQRSSCSGSFEFDGRARWSSRLCESCYSIPFCCSTPPSCSDLRLCRVCNSSFAVSLSISFQLVRTWIASCCYPHYLSIEPLLLGCMIFEIEPELVADIPSAANCFPWQPWRHLWSNFSTYHHRLCSSSTIGIAFDRACGRTCLLARVLVLLYSSSRFSEWRAWLNHFHEKGTPAPITACSAWSCRRWRASTFPNLSCRTGTSWWSSCLLMAYLIEWSLNPK